MHASILMSRSALLLLDPPVTEELPELLPVLPLVLSVPLLPLLVPPLELLEPPELELELWLLPPQLPPWEPRAPVSAKIAIPNTATARTWRSFTSTPLKYQYARARLDGRMTP
ncbi:MULTISPECIES: hypothetical protein [unclassified Streptomyces]|uniref:hypothetical protein n=1 Tax=unclassified Streptomyces TaxID=2593676 RepID=UPI002E2D355A|nr:hypothetical protein [Streptomyces sp. NBC_00273]